MRPLLTLIALLISFSVSAGELPGVNKGKPQEGEPIATGVPQIPISKGKPSPAPEGELPKDKGKPQEGEPISTGVPPLRPEGEPKIPVPTGVPPMNPLPTGVPNIGIGRGKPGPTGVPGRPILPLPKADEFVCGDVTQAKVLINRAIQSAKKSRTSRSLMSQKQSSQVLSALISLRLEGIDTVRAMPIIREVNRLSYVNKSGRGPIGLWDARFVWRALKSKKNIGAPKAQDLGLLQQEMDESCSTI